MTIIAGDKTYDSMDDLFDELDRERAAEPLWKKGWRVVRRHLDYGTLRYAVKRHTKYRWQRGQRGWAENDTWGFDHYLAGVIAGGVRNLIEVNHGHPADICTCEDKWHAGPEGWENCDGNERWLAVLEEMASGFEAYNRDDFDYSRPLDHEAFRKYEEDRREKCQRSLELLKQHFGSLWD